MATKKKETDEPKGVEALADQGGSPAEAGGDDASKAPVAAKPQATTELNPEYDEQLRGYQDYDLRMVRRKRMGVMDDPRVVGHVPADRCCTWATDPRIDGGRHVTMMKGLGFRAVRIDEVTANPAVTTKLLVQNYEEGPNQLVSMGGGVLMIGYRQYRNQRKAAERAEFQQMLDNLDARTDGVGIPGHDQRVEIESKSHRGPMEVNR